MNDHAEASWTGRDRVPTTLAPPDDQLLLRVVEVLPRGGHAVALLPGLTCSQIAARLELHDDDVLQALVELRRRRLARTDVFGTDGAWWRTTTAERQKPGPTEREQAPVPLASVGPLPHWTVDVIERVGPTASSAELRAQLDVVESRLRVIEAQLRAARRAKNELHALLRARLRGRRCT